MVIRDRHVPEGVTPEAVMFAFCAVTSAAAGGVVGRGTVKTGGPRRGSTFRYDSCSVYGVSLPERLAEGSGVARMRCSRLPFLEFPPGINGERASDTLSTGSPEEPLPGHPFLLK